MPRKMVGWLFLAMASLVSANAGATLIGQTVVVHNAAAGTSTSFIVGDGIESFTCVFAISGVCVGGVQIDFGADYIEYSSFNTSDFNVESPGNILTHTFSGPDRIVDAFILSNLSPIDFSVSFTEHSVSYVVNPYLWAAHSVYSNRVHVVSVPEPATLSLLALGLASLLIVRLRRESARIVRPRQGPGPAVLLKAARSRS